MNREQILKLHGETKTKHIAGILHNYVYGDRLDDHYILENHIKTHGDLKFKDAISYFDSILEFEQ